MKTHIVEIADWVASILLVSSFVVASFRKEKFIDSKHYNIINLVTSVVLVVTAVSVGIYGTAVRNGSFAVASLINLARTM
jgi:hypothetical protein